MKNNVEKFVTIDCADNIGIIGTYEECLQELLESPEIAIKYSVRIERASEHGYK